MYLVPLDRACDENICETVMNHTNACIAGSTKKYDVEYFPS